MTTTLAPETTLTFWTDGRDDYGRRVHYFHAPRTVAVVVRLPKPWIEVHGKAKSYLVNIWADPQENVTYHPTLAAAKAHAVTEAARFA